MASRTRERKCPAARSSVAVGYARLLGEDGASAGFEDQRRLIRSEARRRGLSLVWSCDTSDRRETVTRTGIARSLRLLRDEGHTSLIVADLPCLTRSLPVLSAIFRRSAEEGWSIVSLGRPRIDTTRREGRALQAVLGSYYAYLALEDEPGDSTAEADKPAVQPSFKERIVWERISGASLGQIANGLNRDRIPAPRKGEGWLPSAVWAELESLRPASR